MDHDQRRIKIARAQPATGTRARVRRVAGWCAAGLGVLGLVLPGPGLLFIALGIVLIGPHDPTLRRLAIYVHLFLRRWSRTRQRHVRRSGAFVRHLYCHNRQIMRRHLHEHLHGDRSWRAHALLLAMLMFGIAVPAGVMFALWHVIP